jgi:hypothetical protein
MKMVNEWINSLLEPEPAHNTNMKLETNIKLNIRKKIYFLLIDIDYYSLYINWIITKRTEISSLIPARSLKTLLIIGVPVD